MRMKTIKRLEVRAKRISLADVVGERMEDYHAPYSPIREPDDAAGIFQRLLHEQDREIFLVLYLNLHNRVLGYSEAGLGSVDACPVDPREVFRLAVQLGASGIMVAHNHPSGDTTPSTDDIALTHRLMKGGALLNIPLLDHLIIGNEGYVSLAETGVIGRQK